MSRGDRVVVSGNISGSMRVNYEVGVEEYYRKVATTYRNPHFPGVRHCIFSWLNRWWEMDPPIDCVTIFDMACGSGEATLSVKQWWAAGRQNHELQKSNIQRHKTSSTSILSNIPPDTPNPQILAADPYTSAAYSDRTSLPCASLSFRDIAEGFLPPLPSDSQLPDGANLVDQNHVSHPVIDIVICSFALHLVENPSELFALLWELSTKSRWLLIISPHKKPEIKDGWGWTKWDVDTWKECQMSDHKGEILKDRVHCRVFRSLNV